ncbi:MAG: hypothetical protein KatS3mg022_0098 [Armatimonadota bacterium]|nr:MAG: hypothetical protein KatS3mg022_0098 [Armatimonadota bacterium]GIV21533.1 MAG: hypothetical protein KatS3mg023_3284 [Armatimonadota bacterium]
MIHSGQVVLLRFPHADMEEGKLRPALLLCRVPGEFPDWLICMVSSQMRHYITGFDEIVRPEDDDFVLSGLKVESVIRIGRLAVVSEDILLGAIGEVSTQRLRRIKQRLSQWLLQD